MKEIDCSILIFSCDKNVDLLKNFAIQFNRYWNDCKLEKYFCLERSNFIIEGFKTLKSEKKIWSDRVKDYLSQIDTKLVLIMLDDYWIENFVDNEKVEDLISMMEKNSNIGNIAFSNIQDKKDVGFDDILIKRSHKGNYLLNLQIGIWNKKLFAKLLHSGENPWQAELFGSIRASKYVDIDFFSLKDDKLMPIPFNRGWLIVQGKWNGYEVEKFRLQYGLSIDTKGREVLFSNWHKIALLKRVIRRFRIEMYKVKYIFKKNIRGVIE